MSDLPLYLQIYQAYIADIQNGTLSPGDRLPSEMEIAREYNVSRITSKRAMERLRDEGYIERAPGRGSFICERKDQSSKLIQQPAHSLANPKIGLIIPDFSESYGTELITGIEQSARDHGYDLILRRSMGKFDAETKAIDALFNAGCLGIILMPQQNDFFNAKLLRLILDEYPVVIMDRQMKGINAAYIGSDNHQSALEMTLRILEYGHRNIAYMTNPLASASTLQERYSGFKDAFFQSKLIYDENLFLDDFQESDSSIDLNQRVENDLARIIRFLEEHPEVTCIFATEYNFAQLAHEATHQLGYNVPNDISIVGYDGPSSFTGNRHLTRVIQPQEDIGRQAVHTLDQIIKGDDHQTKIILPSTIRNGRSLGPVRQKSMMVKP